MHNARVINYYSPEMAHQNPHYEFCSWIYLPGLWIHNQNYEY